MTALAVTESALGEALRVAALSVYVDELRATYPTLDEAQRAEADTEIAAASRIIRQRVTA